MRTSVGSSKIAKKFPAKTSSSVVCEICKKRMRTSVGSSKNAKNSLSSWLNPTPIQRGILTSPLKSSEMPSV